MLSKFCKKPARKLLVFLSVVVIGNVCSIHALDEYFRYVSELDQDIGSCQQGEIEIVLDPLEISRIQQIQERRLLAKGFSKEQAVEYSRIGVVSEDQYWIWLRDAVYFPKGIPGTYDRLISKSGLQEKCHGVAVLPLLPSGDVLLIVTYRHATRSFEIELPRGGIEPGETPLDAAHRELQEETGCIASSMRYLGSIAVDSGTASTVSAIFLGDVVCEQKAAHEYSEAIAHNVVVTQSEIQEGIVRGYLEVTMDGIKQQIPFRDPFCTFALLQGQYRKLW